MNTMQKGSEAHKLEAKFIALALSNGYDIGRSLSTRDGDFVRIIAVDVIDPAHPLIGEIIDSEMITSQRLARFSTLGTIAAKTPDARAKHSLAKNTKSEVEQILESIMGDGWELNKMLEGLGVTGLFPETVSISAFHLVPDGVMAGEAIAAEKAEAKAAHSSGAAWPPASDESGAPRVQAQPAPGHLRTEFMRLRNEFDALQDHVVKSVGTRLMELRDDVDQNTLVLNTHRADIASLQHDARNLDLRVVRR